MSVWVVSADMRRAITLAMDRQELRAVLEAERVTPDAYDLTGQGKDEAYVLPKQPFGWTLFYSERELERGTETFGHGAEARARLLTVRRNPAEITQGTEPAQNLMTGKRSLGA